MVSNSEGRLQQVKETLKKSTAIDKLAKSLEKGYDVVIRMGKDGRIKVCSQKITNLEIE